MNQKANSTEPQPQIPEAESMDEGEISEQSPAEVVAPAVDDHAAAMEVYNAVPQPGSNKKRKKPDREFEEHVNPGHDSSKARKRAKKEKRKKKREGAGWASSVT